MDDDLSKTVLASGGCSEDSNEELRNTHANSAQEQNRATSPLVNSIQTGDSRADVDTGSNQTDNELVLETRVQEELRAVVEDKVDTGQLLQSLEETSSEKTLAKAALEALGVTSRADAHLVFVVGLDLGEFIDDSGVVSGETAELGKTLDGALVVVSLD